MEGGGRATAVRTEETTLCPLVSGWRTSAAPVERAIAETNLIPANLTSVEIVGGGSRVACVKRRPSGLLGLDANAVNFGLSTTLNADESVARGAALMSVILSPRFKVLLYEIAEAIAHPIRIGWEGPPREPAVGLWCGRGTMRRRCIYQWGRRRRFVGSW